MSKHDGDMFDGIRDRSRKHPQDWDSVPVLKEAAKGTIEMLLRAVEVREKRIEELKTTIKVQRKLYAMYTKKLNRGQNDG